MNRNRLSFKIIVRVLLFCFILGGSIFTIYYLFARKTIERESRENAIHLAESAVYKIEEIINPAEMIPNNLAWIMETNTLSRDSIYAFLKQLVRNNESVFAGAIAFEPHMFSEEEYAFAPYAYRSGEEIRSRDLWSPAYNYFIMDWYQIPALLKKPYWSEPYYDEGGGGVLMTTYSAPFYRNINNSRVLAGIITIDISLEWLTEIVNSVKIFDTGYAFLISGNGVYVTHPNASHIMNQTIFTYAKEIDEPKIREIGRDMISGRSKFSNVDLKEIGKVWIYHTKIPSSKWSLGVVYPHREMYAGLRNLNIMIFLLSMVALVLLTIATIRIINRQIRPLSKFARAARSIAGGDFDTELPAVDENHEMKELHDSFRFMQEELTKYIADLKETTSAKEKIESELRIARGIQTDMIPHIFPPFPNLPEIGLYASLESAMEVGGDLYDFFPIDDDHFCFAIGDVSGKGVPASLFMAVTITLIRSMSEKNRSAAQIVQSVNKTLTINNESNMFVTLFVGILNLRTGELQYCNAGHNPPVLLREGQEPLMFSNTKAIPVGVFDVFDYRDETVMLEKSDQIFLYTDGVTEAEDVDKNLFGEAALLKALSENSDKSSKELTDKVKQSVKEFVNGHMQSDDITMMCITYWTKNENKTK